MVHVEFAHIGKFVTDTLQSAPEVLSQIPVQVQGISRVDSLVGQQYADIKVAIQDCPLGQHS